MNDQLSNYLGSLEKGGRYILKSLLFINLSSNFDENTYPQIKAQSVHFKSIFIT